VIPSQENADFDNPEEHVSWALRNMPTFAGVGAVTHPGFLRQWSRHLVDCGFVHVSYIAKMADKDGNINVSKLPKQRIKLANPIRGARHQYNPAAVWLPVDAPEPPKARIPDINQLTVNEQEGILAQFRAAGRITDNRVEPTVAVEE
jgi:hypothetical protein